MKRKLQQWRSTNSPISTKRLIVSHLHSLSTHTKQQTNKLQKKKKPHDMCDFGNSGPGLGNAQQCGTVKP
jgi:hypothetical protein